MIKNILSLFKSKDFFIKLVERGNDVSSKAWALVIVVLLAVFMIAILAAGMVVDLIYNHTFTISLADVGVLIGALSTMIFSIALPKSLCDKNDQDTFSQSDELSQDGEA